MALNVRSDLTRPLVRTDLTRGLVVASSTPANLFANGEAGAWYDPSDLFTLFQDSGGTTSVTGPGDPVGRMLDKSGNGNHATQSTDAARPVLRQDAGGRYYLEFDGSDDRLIGPNLTTKENWYCATALSVDGLSGATGTEAFFGIEDNADRGFVGARTDSGLFRWIGVELRQSGSTLYSVQYSNTTPAAGERFVTEGYHESLTLFARLNEQTPASTSADLSGTGPGTLLVGKPDVPNSWYGGVFRNVATSDADKKKVRDYIANKSGVTL